MTFELHFIIQDLYYYCTLNDISIIYGFHTLFRWMRYFVCMTKCDNVTRLWHFPLLENLNIHLAIEKIIIYTKVDNSRPDFVSFSYVNQFRLPFRMTHHGKLQMPQLLRNKWNIHGRHTSFHHIPSKARTRYTSIVIWYGFIITMKIPWINIISWFMCVKLKM